MSTTVSQPRATEKFSKSLGGSLKSLVGASGRTYFVLEHKTTTQKYRTGQTTEFIGDYIELGRGSNFAVGFGDDCTTVSRPHAAIIRKGGGWVIKSLSKTNPTLVNGQSLRDEVLLHNGDDIQLSYEGPRVAFLTPPNNSVKSMGMTIRLKAMANEAIKPYKTAVATLAVLLVAAVSGGYYFFNKANNFEDLYANSQIINEQQKQELIISNEKSQKAQKELKNTITSLERRIKVISGSTPIAPHNDSNDQPVTTENLHLSQLYPNVYYIRTSKIIVEIGGTQKQVEFGGSGTGFLLSDGRFVTARHVLEPWHFIANAPKESQEELIKLNILANNGGKITHFLEAYSPSGTAMQMSSQDFMLNQSGDETKQITADDGTSFILRIASLNNGTDWAVSRTSRNGGLDFAPSLSASLSASTPLYILGYSFGMGVNNPNDIKPLYNECNVARDGLSNGVIYISNRGFDQGNSGGPVFTKTNNRYVVVGIVSGGAGAQGLVVPITAIR
ncbi:FHA domain-containing protein [Runella zeae]|jgi:hypothetical protein|uniref:FHA domain-containing protein n=1 Tax=Runella zeae TaxID=94255 RepID=UPI00041521F6|nr:FHA domain-containing protein [Runella zeae]